MGSARSRRTAGPANSACVATTIICEAEPATSRVLAAPSMVPPVLIIVHYDHPPSLYIAYNTLHCNLLTT